MHHAGAAWRGWFPVGGELTSGRPDLKEGIYFGLEHGDDHPLVMSGTALHGLNLFPRRPVGLGDVVHEWMDAMRTVADAVLRAMAIGLRLPLTWFEDDLTADPTVLFRIFHYPAQSEPDGDEWGVGEHTDYGLITLLAQDRNGGLQVRHPVDQAWIDVQPADDVLICNLGDMLDRMTGGRYTSTPHRVRNVSGVSRLSFPYFFDPSWDATVSAEPLIDSDGHEITTRTRWDGQNLQAWEGTYGDVPHGEGGQGVPRPLPRSRQRNRSETSFAIRRPARVSTTRSASVGCGTTQSASSSNVGSSNAVRSPPRLGCAGPVAGPRSGGCRRRASPRRPRRDRLARSSRCSDRGYARSTSGAPRRASARHTRSLGSRPGSSRGSCGETPDRGGPSSRPRSSPDRPR